MVAGVATCKRRRKGQRTIWASERVRGTGSRVTPVEGRTLAYGELGKPGRSGDWRSASNTEAIRDQQNKLYRKAKDEDGSRFEGRASVSLR